MTLTAQNDQSAKSSGLIGKLDIGTTPCHIGCDRYGFRATCLGDNFCFPRMVLRIQHFVRNPLFAQQLMHQLTGFNGNRSNQYRLPLFIQFLNLFHQSRKLQSRVRKNRIRIVDTLYRSVCRNFNNTHIIDIQEFLFLGFCGTGHTGKLIIQTEEVLIGDRCKGTSLFLNGYTFLGLNRLMQSIGICTAWHRTPGKLIDNDDLIILYDVLNLIFHDIVRL